MGASEVPVRSTLRPLFGSLLALALTLTAATGCRAQDKGSRTPDPSLQRELPKVEVPPPKEGQTYARCLVFGDMGTGRRDQKKVAEAMAARARAEPIDFMITTGDNFYPSGVTAADDPKWDAYIWKVYDQESLNVPIYPSLGNHDHQGKVQAQVEHSKRNPRWRLPATYHTYTIPLGPDASAQFFVLDTQTLGDEQVAWLDRELAASKATWKLVYGHFPLYSHSIRGHSGGMIRRLEPTLVKHQVDLYLAGHDHTLEMLKPVKGVNYVVSGGGGGPDMSYAVTWNDEETLFAATGGGFVALRLGKDELVLEFIRLDAKTQWAHVIPRRGVGPAPGTERLGPY